MCLILALKITCHQKDRITWDPARSPKSWGCVYAAHWKSSPIYHLCKKANTF